MSAPSDLLFAKTARRRNAVAGGDVHQAQCAGRDGVLGSSALLALAAATQAAPAAGAAQSSAPAVAPAPKVRINPTKRVLRFVVPLTDNGNYLGDVALAVDPPDTLPA